MKRRLFFASAMVLALVATAPAIAHAQASQKFPDNPIRMVVPFAPGGTTDTFARLFSQHFGEHLGVPVIVVNQPGGGGQVATRALQRAAPDGYTLVFQSPTSGVTGPLTRKELPYDPVAGFAHIAILGMTPIVLGVSNKSGVQSLAQLVAHSKNSPGGINYATGGVGGGPHLSVELLKKRSDGLDALHVPYRGAGPAIQDLISGEVSFMPDTFTSLLPLHESGRIKIVAVFDEERSTVAPNIPTAKEQGVDIVTRIANYIAAPAGTPKERLEILAAAAREAMKNPAMIERLGSLGYRPVTDSTPESATRFIADEVALWKPVIQDAGIALE
ncbi:tripartite tricarboxylate transporter substrate binding protein [Candidimonas sp. SYP-B2681]|uniref:Bug family tripartite tricarboxylate transporter substrate binding protein n=1 Tax=Candidimonas sp. SYP-B2681 TaxID=2497686 RepID=UPI000F8959F7|nr:tripartite tricarboxylate transporter substrate binding protein [Candidimonas sp. SYP-B2681]RTZ48216.1 tripartite tricarboxylate transporter substrate binding protein [Candidimonas sp. SYP-B2681]